MKSINKRKLTSQELSNIKSCDIILVRSSGWISKTIRQVIGSEWSHVAIYIQDGKVIDTDILEKVNYRDINDFEEFKVLRYEELTEDDKEKIILFMSSNINKEYDYSQIVGFILEYQFGFKNSIHEQEKYTCSKLIDIAFKMAGIDLFNAHDGDVTPKEISECKKLKEV